MGNKKRITKNIGYISEEILIKYSLFEYKDIPIIQSLDFYSHIQKHIADFNDVNIFNEIATNLDKIIQNPIVVYYEKNKNSLLYYGKLKTYVCVVVKLSKTKEHYVATMYPINENKLTKMKEKSYILN